MPQGFETRDPIVQAGVRAKVAPLRSLRRRYYTLHLPGQDPVVLEVDTRSNQVVSGPPGYVGGDMAHVSARHSGRMGVRIEEHPVGELPPAPLARNVSYRDPTPEPARPPAVREAEGEEAPYWRGKLRRPLTFHELSLPSGGRLVVGANEQGIIESGPHPLLGGDVRQVLAQHGAVPGAQHRQYGPGELPTGWDRHPVHGVLPQSDVMLGPRTTEDAYAIAMAQAHRPEAPVPEGLSSLNSPSGEAQRPETGPQAPSFNPRSAAYNRATQDLRDVERPMYENPAGRWGLSLPERVRLENLAHGRSQAGALYESSIVRPEAGRALPQADSRTPGLLNPLHEGPSGGEQGAGLPPAPPSMGPGGASPAPAPPPPPAPPRGASLDPTTGIGPVDRGRPGPLARLPRRAAQT